jgi:hypothetical protein
VTVTWRSLASSCSFSGCTTCATRREPSAIYILEMGEQIRIFNVVRHLIGLAGYVPDHNITIDMSASLARNLMSN